jgi:hypothetical protein
LVQVSVKFKVLRRNYIKFYQILNLENSLIFHSKFLLNLKKLLWIKLFIFSRSSELYFISYFWSLGRSNLDQSKFERVSNSNLNEFEGFDRTGNSNPALWPGPIGQRPAPPRIVAGPSFSPCSPLFRPGTRPCSACPPTAGRGRLPATVEHCPGTPPFPAATWATSPLSPLPPPMLLAASL